MFLDECLTGKSWIQCSSELETLGVKPGHSKLKSSPPIPKLALVPAAQVPQVCAPQQWARLLVVADLLFLICEPNFRASTDALSILSDIETDDDFGNWDFFSFYFSSFIAAVFEGHH